MSVLTYLTVLSCWSFPIHWLILSPQYILTNWAILPPLSMGLLSNSAIMTSMLKCNVTYHWTIPFYLQWKKNHKRNLELDKFEAENSTFTYLFINVSFKFGYYNVSTHFPMSLSKSADQYHSTILGKHICLYISIVYKFLIILPCF